LSKQDIPMSQPIRPRRSTLFIPADNHRALRKITPALAADCIIIDLEDAVSPSNKAGARAELAQVLADVDTGGRELLLRINAPDTEDYPLDVALISQLSIDGVVLPKVEQASDVQELASVLDDSLSIWVMLETARGVLAAPAICDAHQSIAGLMVGTQDLGLDLRLAPGAGDSDIIEHCLMQCALAARAAGIAIIDAVCPDFKDLDPLKHQCQQAISRGFDGKAAIHPAQLQIINDAFSPKAEQLEQARGLLAAWEQSQQAGDSLATYNGRMIEALHAEQAQQLLDKAKAIDTLHHKD